MPICMLMVYFLASEFLLLSIPASILLAAALAPTDPVLAAEVQIENFMSEKSNNVVEFALTAEAGINDGVAFPFIFLAVLLADNEFTDSQWEFLFQPLNPPRLAQTLSKKGNHTLAKAVFNYLYET